MVSCRVRLVTMDETWLYCYDPKTKQKSIEWRHSGSPRPKNIRVQKSTGKYLVPISWGEDGIFLIYYLPKGQTINAEYYSLKGHHFSSDAEVIAAAETWLDGQRSDFFLFSGLQKLEQRATKYIELRGSRLNKSRVWLI